jgi:predicted dehydrogenase
MKLRIGVVGLGIMGDQYTRIYQRYPLTDVVAVASRTPAKTSEFAAKHNIRHACATWEDLLEREDVDAVCIATPDDAHFAPAKRSLELGKHVLIEKPMTTNLQEADALVTLARASTAKVQVAFNHRWLAPYHQGKLAIQSGAIGQPISGYARKNDTIFVPTEYIPWAGQTTPAWFLSCHDIDLVRWMFNSEPVEARAWGVKRVLIARGIDTWDTIQAQVRFASGAIAVFESAWIYPNTFPTMVDSFVAITGEAGHLHFDRKRESIEMSTSQAFTYPKCFLSNEVFGTLRGAFPACLEDFARCVLEDRPPACGVEDGRQVTAVLTAIHESLESGKSIAIQQPQETFQ